MKLVIDGIRLDTDKASHHWDLWYNDGSNSFTGDVYRSSKGTWYMYTPSQWANRHSWVLMTPEEILSAYPEYLSDGTKAEIAELAGLGWE